MIREDVVAALVATGKWSEGTARLSERAAYKCEYCDFDLLASIDAYKLLEVDHIVPIKRGGDPVDFENLALACRHCNWSLKRSWNPRAVAGDTASRSELIAAVREYISGIREGRDDDLRRVRQIVGYSKGDA